MLSSSQLIGLLGAGYGLLLALAVVPICAALATRIGVVDRPGGRKLQRAPVPLFGGLAVAISALLAVFAAVRWGADVPGIREPVFRRVALAGGLILLIGLVDDVFKDKVGALPKFIGQLVAVVLLFGDRYLAVLSGEASLGASLHLLATTLWFLTVVNAINFVDNMNGLCAGLGMISLLVAVFGLGGAHDTHYALVAGALGGALLGFLPYNYPKARVYLGDAGSHFVGFFLALVTLEFTSGFMSGGSRLFGLDAFVPAILLLGLPLFDLLFSVVRRWREGRSMFHGDARHLSHRLVGAGLDPASAVMLLWGVHLILAAWGVVTLDMGGAGRFAVFAVILVFLGLLSNVLVRVEHRVRRERRGAGKGDNLTQEEMGQ